MASTSDRQTEDKHLLARVSDAFEISNRRYTPHYVGFLDERQAALVRAQLPKNDTRWCFFGGHADAERVILGVAPTDHTPQECDFPLVRAAFHFGKYADLSHRDVLGGLLGCGITREKVGDILCDKDRAVVFLHQDIVGFVSDNVKKLGNVGVKIELPYDGELPVFHRFESISGTVASARLDAVLKVLLGTSRERACAVISEDRVQVDHQSVTSTSFPVREGQVLSVRGSGRFVIDAVSGTTKKGRLVLQARRYV